jgi:hypothetical protein
MEGGEMTLGVIVFAGVGALSYLCFSTYLNQPDIKDVKLIQQSVETLDETLTSMDKLGSSYITSDNSTLPLTYALERMDIVRQDNPDKAKNIDRLIAELNAAKNSEETLTNTLLYRMALKGAGADLKEYAATNRNGAYIALGVLAGLVSLLGVALFVEGYKS